MLVHLNEEHNGIVNITPNKILTLSHQQSKASE